MSVRWMSSWTGRSYRPSSWAPPNLLTLVWALAAGRGELRSYTYAVSSCSACGKLWSRTCEQCLQSWTYYRSWAKSELRFSSLFPYRALEPPAISGPHISLPSLSYWCGSMAWTRVVERAHMGYRCSPSSSERLELTVTLYDLRWIWLCWSKQPQSSIRCLWRSSPNLLKGLFEYQF